MECRVNLMIFKVLVVMIRNITIFWCMTSQGVGKFCSVSEGLADSIFRGYTEYMK
jgi:hypothetical protein